jgi:hypothetical protein
MSSSDTGSGQTAPTDAAARKTATPKEMVAIGTLCAAVGLYFMLVGAGLLPIPGGPKNLHAPLWIVFFCGMPFFLGGFAVLLQGFGKANEQGELPATAPHWMRVGQYLIGVAIFASFAIVGSWIALAGEAGQFSGFGGVTIARVAFGIGAIIVWLCTIGFAVSGARKLRAARQGQAS